MFVCPGRSTTRISAYLGSVCHSNCFQIICHLSTFSPKHFELLAADFLTPMSLSGTPLHLPVDLAPSLLSTSLSILTSSISPRMSHSPSQPLCLLTSSPLASLIFFPLSHLTSTSPTNLSGTTCRNFQFLPTDHHHLSFQCTHIIPTARLLDFIKNTNPLISTMFTTLTPLPPHSLGNPA